MDPEMREALDQLAANLRGEIRALDSGLRALDGGLRSVDTGLRGAIDQLAVDLRGEIQSSATEVRRHFDVVGESLRSDIRAVIEGMAASREQTDRRIDEEAGRTDGLTGRVVRLEVRVKDLEDGRKPRRAPRRPRS